MNALALKFKTVEEELQAEIAKGWSRTLSYFRKRGGVVFFSDSHFWGSHGFVQQSLARTLAAEGVPVLWLDGVGWRPYRPVVKNAPAGLEVRQLLSFPGRRFEAVDRAASEWGGREITRRLTSGGRKAVFWVQSGMIEALAAQVPYIDVYSVFDDPTRNLPPGPLCHKSKIILCQNRKALEILGGLGDKVQMALPPMDLGAMNGSEKEFELPAGFPKQVMGYIGSFGSRDFDFVLFENLIHALPDYGFVLAGRTDVSGMGWVAMLKDMYPNFHYVPWVPREQIRSIWQKLCVSLLLYRGTWHQDGAFATKILESVFFGTGCVATPTPKTEEIGKFFPRVHGIQALVEACVKVAANPGAGCEAAYRHFAFEMNPKLHLIRVADQLAEKE